MEHRAIPAKEGFASESVTPVTALSDGVFPSGSFKVSCDNPGTTTGNDLLRYDLVNFVRVNCPKFLIDSIPSLVDAFCKKWPGYKNDPGPEYICQLAEKMAERGWKCFF